MVTNKKKISSIIVALFTTFIVLSGTAAWAFTPKVVTPASLLLDAQTSVSATYFILSTSAYDLATNQKSILKSNTAVLKATNAIYPLSKNTADYKILNAKLVADLKRMINARKNVVAVKATEVIAAAAAEAAINALEVAPRVTVADRTAAKTLQVTAIAALDKVRDSVKVKVLTARLKVVTDKLATL